MRSRQFCGLALALLAAGCPEDKTSKTADMAMALAGDMATDGGGGTCVTGANCTLAGAMTLCKNATCVACTDTTDDAACQAGYGSASTNYICQGGACVAGCRTSGDCAGQICGLSTANKCGACTTDAQCVMLVGADQMCNTAAGTCVSNACPTASMTCAANAADVCCNVSGTNRCVAGTCCVKSDCMGTKNCIAGVCTDCPAATGNVFYVDPSEPSNTGSTGANVPGCRYRSITAAVAAVGAPAVPTTIHVLGTQMLAESTGETFPISVLANVTILGDAAQRPTLSVPTTHSGFALAAPSSVVTNITVDGNPDGGTTNDNYGFVVTAPSPSPSPAPALDHVTARNFTFAGIGVNGGSLEINAGVTMTANHYGVDVSSDYSYVKVNGAGAGDPISFSKNDFGLRIRSGAVALKGNTAGGGDIRCNENGVGMLISDIGAALGSQNVTISGIVASGNTDSGIEITPHGRQPVSIRQSVATGNTHTGVHIKSAGTGMDATQLDYIDLGTNHSGGNTLQGAAANLGAGICLESSAGTLKAQGNQFSAHDCSMVAAGALSKATDCISGTDVGILSGATIDANYCTIP